MTSKRTRSLLGTATAVVALAAFFGLATAPVAPAQAQKPLKLTSYVPVGSGTWNLYHKPFIDHVHDLTDGEVKIKIPAGSQPETVLRMKGHGAPKLVT